jgi:hypothetical protein
MMNSDVEMAVAYFMKISQYLHEETGNIKSLV